MDQRLGRQTVDDTSDQKDAPLGQFAGVYRMPISFSQGPLFQGPFLFHTSKRTFFFAKRTVPVFFSFESIRMICLGAKRRQRRGRKRKRRLDRSNGTTCWYHSLAKTHTLPRLFSRPKKKVVEWRNRERRRKGAVDFFLQRKRGKRGVERDSGKKKRNRTVVVPLNKKRRAARLGRSDRAEGAHAPAYDRVQTASM